MPPKSVTPSIRETAFDCPHCGAYTTQTWYDLYARLVSGESRTPILPDKDNLELLRKDKQTSTDDITFYQRWLSGDVCLRKFEEGDYFHLGVFNINLSRCFSCGKFAVWIHDRLAFPAPIEGPSANPDLPENVRVDYEEAGRILNLSPRGSAALLRLAIQKLCAALGEKGKNIDDDIASLVKKGLSPLVQQALDAVRVIGNEAVHPGTLDLKDDRDTATKLFALVNIIAEQMISNPKHVKEIYEKIPEEKRKAIERRDSNT
jgi:DNA-directed RNA polymerase subunit N (RpoN/RPB10)